MITLDIKKRNKKIKLQAIRDKGDMPAVFYGPKEEATSISLSNKDFLKVWKEAGESTIITLKDGDESYDVLIQEVVLHPVKETVLHADFYAIEKGKKLTVSVELEFEGEAPAEKTLGGSLVKVMYEVEIEALPKDLPHGLVVDISSLVDFDSQIKAGDIKLPEGVELTIDPEEVVALVQAPREEEEEEPVTAPDLSSIEVEGEKKADAEEGEGSDK